MNKSSPTPADGEQYLQSLAQKERAPIAPTFFTISPNKIPKIPQITWSLVYEEADMIWNHDLFNKEWRDPIDVLDTQGLLNVPIAAYANEMLVKMPGSDELTLPENFRPLIPLLQANIDIDASHFERFRNDYIYLTYQEDYMEIDWFQRFHGCHVDGFQSHRVDPKLPIDRLYLTIDRDPTIFYPHAFDMSPYNTHEHDFFAIFNKLSQEEKAVALQANKLYLFNAVSVHRASPTTQAGYRRFFRLTFSRRINDRAGSTKNPHIDYNWDFRLQQSRAAVRGIIW